MPLSPTPRLSTHYRTRLRGEARVRKAQQLAQEYVAGASIRAIAGATEMSYGTVRKLLLEADVTLRNRGGAMTGGRSAKAAG